MIPDYPKLRTPLLALTLAALMLAITLKGKDLPEWIRLFTALLALVFGVTGVVTLADWIAHNAAERLHEVNSARVWGAVSLAGALKGLTPDQTDAVMAGERVAMQMIITDNEPVFFIRGLTRNIPWTFAEEFFRRSMMTYPFLWPIRDAGNEALATDLTNLVVSLGWAEKHVGPFSAKLTKPLAWVATRFMVELPEELEREELVNE